MQSPILYDGTGKPPAEQYKLKAGSLSAIFEAGMLRNIRLENQEIVRTVYAAVRDHNWGTIPAQLHDLKMESEKNTFKITFTAEHKQNDIHFVWDGEIIGSADGTITFSFDGEAKTSFKRNRVGFCILHPLEIAGVPCDIEHTDGTVERGAFPKAIEPHQPYFDIRAIRHEVVSSIRAEVRMEGDTFEMEDQRNWTDASYKTYCTPLAAGFPVTLEAGTKIQQRVTISLLGKAGGVTVYNPDPALWVDAAPPVPMPTIGLGMASHGQPLSEQEISRLKALNLAHLRVDIYPQADPQAVLRRAVQQSRAVGCGLEIAVHVGENAEQDLSGIAVAAATEKPDIVRWLVFDYQRQGTRLETMASARRILGTFDAPIGSGTNGFFTDLNRNRPMVNHLDWVAYSINPQVHAFDNTSLVETLLTAGSTVENARSFSGSAKIAVTPVTLKMRRNPNIPGTAAASQKLPADVDVRQMSLFGAAWTLGNLKSLISGGVSSVTYYETTGWLGVMERQSGSPLPDKFPSTPGGVFPMYHVLDAVSAFVGGEAQVLASTHPLKFDGMVLRSGGKTRILIANTTPEPQEFDLTGITGASFVQKSLDETTADTAINTPEAYRTQPGTPLASLRKIKVLPYAVTVLDQVSE